MGDTLKYYVYLSDTKIEMLYSQIPQPLLKRIAAELNINLKLMAFEVGVAVKGNQSEQTRYSKLRIVTKYIEKHYEVGTLDDPQFYFRGTLPMRWGPYSDLIGQVQMVFFGGDNGHTVVGLGGSLQHVIGQPPSPRATSYSATPYLLSVLEKELEESNHLSSSQSQVVKARDMPFGGSEKEVEEHALNAVALATEQMTGPKQMFEFLAKKLLYGNLPKGYAYRRGLTQVVLGTPIYVAEAN